MKLDPEKAKRAVILLQKLANSTQDMGATILELAVHPNATEDQIIGAVATLRSAVRGFDKAKAHTLTALASMAQAWRLYEHAKGITPIPRRKRAFD